MFCRHQFAGAELDISFFNCLHDSNATVNVLIVETLRKVLSPRAEFSP